VRILGVILLFAIITGNGAPMHDEPKRIFLPVGESVVTSPFGYRTNPVSGNREFHEGVDLLAPEDAPILAVGTGRVVFSGKYRGYGNIVVIRHAQGITSHYAHCKILTVKAGYYVKGGQVIGAVGRTGRATGYHLHFEIRRNGRPVDPLGTIPELQRDKT